MKNAKMTRKRVNDTQPSETSLKRYRAEANCEATSESICGSGPRRSEDLSLNKYVNRTGKILRMRLQNFMCHSNLVVDFGSRANFLVGGNGSGKSAVLTALVVGLGGRANVTNRGAAIKNLIKSGEPSANIEIDICNAGPFEYKKELFGKQFTVVRHITSSGASTYKIINESGKVILKGSEATNELQSFLVTHNIQPQNIVFVLNQDMARSFLKDSDPSKNYELFLKATQMDVTRKNLDDCYTMARKYKHDVESSVKTLSMYKNEEAELRGKLNLLKSVEDLKMKKQEYLVEKSWLKVQDQEEKNAKLQEDIEKVTLKIRKIEEKLKDTSALSAFQKEKQELNNELAMINNDFSAENKILRDLKAERSKYEEKQQIENAKIRKIRDKINDIESQIADLNRGINEIANVTSSGVSQMREKNEAEIRDLESKNEELDRMIQNARNDLKAYRDTRSQLQERSDEISRRIHQTSDNSSRIQAEINRINSSPKENLNVYSEHMGALLASIDRAYAAGKFSQKPIGPIGRYIEVPDKKWRTVIENVLRGVLRAFIVNSTHDRNVLDGILSREFPMLKLDIITSRFQNHVYDVQGGMVMEVPGSHLLLNKIKCNNPVIINRLIDSFNIETLLLVERQDLAIKLTVNEENVPQNLSKVILLQPPLQYLPSPGYRIYPQEMHPPRYLQINNEDRKIQLQEQLEENEQEIQSYRNDLLNIKTKLKELDKFQEEKSHYLDKHRRAYDNNLSSINELKNVEYPSKEELTVLTNELKEMQDSHVRQVEEKKAAEERLKDWKEKYGEVQDRIRKQESAARELEKQMMGIKTKLDEIVVMQSSSQNNNQRHQKAKDELETQLKDLNTWLKKESEVLTKLVAEAENVGARVECTSTMEQIDRNIKKIDNRIKTSCTITDTVDEVERNLTKKSEIIEDLESAINAIKLALEKLKESNLLKFENVKVFKEHVRIRIEFKFERLLSVQNYDGHIELRSDNSTLTISVVPRDGHISNAVSNTKQLSGGERSYITTSFLIALWSSIDHPFYCLDEYDVFTDQLNREILTKLLLRQAKEIPQCQYVFLTPLDMSFLESTDYIKIHKFAERKN